MTQQGDMTSRSPGEDASLAGLPGTEAGTASVPAEAAPAAPAGPSQEPPRPSPYLSEGQAAPEAYAAPARPGQPKYGTPSTTFQGARQAGFRQQGYGRQPTTGPSGGPRQAGRPGPRDRAARPRDPSLASAGERLLAMSLDWLLIFGASFLPLHQQMTQLLQRYQSTLVAAQAFGTAAEQNAMRNFAKSPATHSTLDSYFLVAFLIALVYFWVMEATAGATLGKLALGLRVVNATDRTSAGVRAAGLRTMAFLIAPAVLALGDGGGGGLLVLVGACVWIADCVVLLSDPQRQSLHDRVAGTLVVRTARRGRSRPG